MNSVIETENEVVEYAAETPKTPEAATASQAPEAGEAGGEDTSHPQNPQDADLALVTEMAAVLSVAVLKQQGLDEANKRMQDLCSQMSPDSRPIPIRVGEELFVVQKNGFIHLGIPYKVDPIKPKTA